MKKFAVTLSIIVLLSLPALCNGSDDNDDGVAPAAPSKGNELTKILQDARAVPKFDEKGQLQGYDVETPNSAAYLKPGDALGLEMRGDGAATEGN